MTAEGMGPIRLGRRSLLRGSLLGGTLVMTGMNAACSTGSPEEPAPVTTDRAPQPTRSGPRPSILVAYFSRPGENYYCGARIDLEVGNAELVARMVSQQLGCDLHRIEAADPYSRDYEATVARNVREQDADARPEIANPLDSIGGYDVVLLGSPIWKVRSPMILRTFAERYDFTGKTVHPFTTYAMSGLGTAARDYAAARQGARIAEGLSVHGEKVADAGPAVSTNRDRGG